MFTANVQNCCFHVLFKKTMRKSCQIPLNSELLITTVGVFSFRYEAGEATVVVSLHLHTGQLSAPNETPASQG